MSTNHPTSRAPRPEHSPVTVRALLLPTLLVFLSFALYATWRFPPPGVNEPHYLCKAKHLWNPPWCGRDMFLQSANAHWLFLETAGFLTQFLSLPQTAWVGRVAAWLLLAWGWTRLTHALVPGRWTTGRSSGWTAIWAAWCFLAIAEFGNFSGEWIVGGVESKVPAYASLFVALACLVRSEWSRAAIWCGLAMAWHPVVGVWGLLAGIFALLPEGVRALRQHSVDWRRLALACVLLLVCSLPGLVPAVAMLLSSPSPEIARAANHIQVFDRLPHHLNPERFSRRAYLEYGALLVAWLALLKLQPAVEGGSQGAPNGEPRRGSRRFVLFVWGATLIAGAGLALAWGTRNAGLMKFYPFRLFDAVLPLAVGIASAGALQRWRGTRQTPSRGFRAAATLGLAALIAASLLPGPSSSDPGHLGAERQADFLTACDWIREHTPPDALVLTSRYLVDFKWYAERAEYVTIKDCPQDAAGIVEWRRRLDWVNRWRRAHIATGFTDAAVAELARETSVDYVLAWNIASHDPYRRPAEYKNRWFAVYRTQKP